MSVDIKKLKVKLDLSWERCVKDAANLNNLYEHIGLLTTALMDVCTDVNRVGNKSVQFGSTQPAPIVPQQAGPAFPDVLFPTK